MDIRIQSVKFDADIKLTDFVNKKVEKLEHFMEGRIMGADVTLSLIPEHTNKKVTVTLEVPGHDLRVERHADSFETAVNDCVDNLKTQISRIKGKMNG